jgi:hypothetical protein
MLHCHRLESRLYGGKQLRLMVNQTRQTFPMGTALQAWRSVVSLFEFLEDFL